MEHGLVGRLLHVRTGLDELIRSGLISSCPRLEDCHCAEFAMIVRWQADPDRRARSVRGPEAARQWSYRSAAAPLIPPVLACAC